MEQALAPLKRLAAQAVESHRVAMAEYEQAARLAKLRAEAGEKAARAKLAKNPGADVSGDLLGNDAQAPTLRRHIANDSTAAALGELLRQNPDGVLVHRDEMVSLLKGLDREDNAEARGFYLTGWNSNSAYTFDRIGRGMHLHIPAVCLSLLGSTQPGRIAEYLRAAVKGGAGDDGLIQRFGLLVWPDVGGEWRDVDRWPDSEARRKANAVFEALDRLNAEAIGGTKDDFDAVPFLRFDAGGLALFREWRQGWEAKLRAGELHPALESHLAKYRKLVPSLALILHLAGEGTGPVGKRATLQALAWAEYLEGHARRAYASVTSSEVTAARAILEKLRRGELPRTFAARDIYRRGWAHLADRGQVFEALQLLADLDRLAVHTRDTNGRTATLYETNPKGLEP
jgi:putative DNA primase/helicase